MPSILIYILLFLKIKFIIIIIVINFILKNENIKKLLNNKKYIYYNLY